MTNKEHALFACAVSLVKFLFSLQVLLGRTHFFRICIHKFLNLLASFLIRFLQLGHDLAVVHSYKVNQRKKK